LVYPENSFIWGTDRLLDYELEGASCFIQLFMKLFLVRVSFTLITAVVSPGIVQAASISSTVNEDNGATANGFGNQSVWHVDPTTEHPAVVTAGGGLAGTGYDFSSTFSSLSSISMISVTLTIQDGNSGSGDFDFNHLMFYLGGARDPNTGLYTGGVNTGIVLNGFRGSFTDTLSFSLAVDPNTTGAAILAQLNANGGKLPGFVVTDNAGDTAPNGNQMFLGNSNLPSNATTTLTLSSIPEPATSGLIALGILFAAAPQIRRLRKNI
jgi:hypothetical protein